MGGPIVTNQKQEKQNKKTPPPKKKKKKKKSPIKRKRKASYVSRIYGNRIIDSYWGDFICKRVVDSSTQNKQKCHDHYMIVKL